MQVSVYWYKLWLIVYLCLQKLFHRPGTGFKSGTLYVAADEVSIATILNETVSKFPSVAFGSYPKLFHRLVAFAVMLCNPVL